MPFEQPHGQPSFGRHPDQFMQFDNDAPERRYRDGATFHGYNVSDDEELLVMDDASSVLERATVEQGRRVVRWLDEQGLWTYMSQRLKYTLGLAAGVAAATKLREQLEQSLRGVEPEREQSSQALARIDPLFVMQLLDTWRKEMLEGVETLHTLITHFSIFEPRLAAEGEQALRRLARAITLISQQRELFMQRFLERIAHGIPAWDSEQGVELALEPDAPSMPRELASGGPEALQAEQDAQRQADVIFQRLIGGWSDAV